MNRGLSILVFKTLLTSIIIFGYLNEKFTEKRVFFKLGIVNLDQNIKNKIMKKLSFISVLLIFAYSCDDDSENLPAPYYSIEGKWLIEGMIPAGNTMYGNHIPGPLNYTYENNILTVDLNFGNELVTPITFECDGGEAIFETPGYSLFRLNSGCN